MITYLVRTLEGFYGHDGVTGNVTLDAPEYRAQAFHRRDEAERIAHSVAAGRVVVR
jgi:hypothetical protein